MPTYEYQCLDCGEHFDIVQSFKDKPLKVHAVCGGGLQKVFHASGVVFKGSGYYVTDSRSSPASASSSGGSDSAAGSDSNGGSSNGSPESKSAPSDKPGKSAEKKTAKKTTDQSSAAAD